MSRIFWDTNLFIYLIEDYGPFSERVAALRRRMIERNDQLLTSALTLGEVLVRPFEVGDEALAEQYRQSLTSGATRAPDLLFRQLYSHLIGAHSLHPLARRPLPSRRFNVPNRHSPTQFVHVRVKNRSARSIVYELPVAPGFHQTGACQLLEMMRDRRLSDGKASAQTPTSNLGLLRDVLENLEPSRIGQRLCDPLELLGIHG